MPDYTTLYRFLKRLDDTIDRGLTETVRQLRRRRSARVTAGVDGTGLSHNAVSTFFIRRIEQHSRGMTQHRHWLKWLIVAELQQQIVLAQRARQGPWCDTRALPGLVDAAAARAPLGLVLADAEFDSEANHQHIRQRWRAHSIIPANRRRGVPNGTIRNQMVSGFSTEAVWAARQGRNYLLGGQTQTLFPRSGPYPGTANSSSPTEPLHLS